MFPEEAVNHIEKGAVKPLYLLHGPEHFYKHEIVLALRRQILKDGDPGMALSEYDGGQTEAARVLDDLRTMTFFGGMRLVIVENADPFIKANNHTLAKYAQSPSKTGCLVLLCDEKPDARLGSTKAIEHSGVVVPCAAPKGARLSGWARNRARLLGKTLAPKAADALAGIVGADLAQIDSHLQMLLTHVGDRKTIEEADVLGTVQQEKVTEIWDLVDGVAAKNAKQALEALDRLLPKTGMESARLALIGGTIIKLRTAKLLLEKFRNGSKVVQMLKMHPYAAQKTVDQSKKFTRDELELGLRKALDADIAIKSNKMAPRLAVEKYIVELCK